MQIITLDENEFDNFAKNHRYESYMQTSNYATLNEDEKNGIHYLGFIDNDELVGACMCIYKKLFWGYSYAYIPRGILMDYDNPYMVNTITAKLKKLLYKQKYIFIKMDPPIIVSERDCNGNVLYASNTVDNIMGTLKENNYEHMGFNLYYETKQPRWNAFIKLNKDAKELFNSFSNDVKEQVRNASQIGIKVYEDKDFNVDQFHEIIKNSYQKISKQYIQKLYDVFKKTNDVNIYYAKLDSNEFVKNANKFYENEEMRNRSLAEIVSSKNNKYDMQRVINDKMNSDKLLHKYKNEVVAASNFLRRYPQGKILSAAMVIKHKYGADCILISEDKELSSYNATSLMIYEMAKIYGNMNLRYLSLGPVTGNFDKKSPYYRNTANKQGYNSSIIEYIGEFDLIINPTMYKIFKYKLKKKQIKL